VYSCAFGPPMASGALPETRRFKYLQPFYHFGTLFSTVHCPKALTLLYGRRIKAQNRREKTPGQ